MLGKEQGGKSGKDKRKHVPFAISNGFYIFTNKEKLITFSCNGENPACRIETEVETQHQNARFLTKYLGPSFSLQLLLKSSVHFSNVQFRKS